MLDIALLNFIGAGLASCAPVHELKTPSSALAHGMTLTRVLYQYDQFKTQEFVEGTIREIWLDWQASSLPVAVAEAHLTALPGILRDAQPEHETLITAFAIVGTNTKLGDSAIAGQARRIASEIIDQARQKDLFAQDELSDTIAFFFLETLFRRLLGAKSYLDAMKPRLASYLDQQLWDYIPELTESALEAQRKKVKAQPSPLVLAPKPDTGTADPDSADQQGGTYLTRLRASLKLISDADQSGSESQDLPLKSA